MPSTYRRTSAVTGDPVPRLQRTLVLLVAGAVLGVLTVAGATSAQAHNTLRSTDPADGSTIEVAPGQVTLTFDEPAVALGTQVEVRSADGTIVSAGDPVLLDATVTQALVDDRPAGLYTVSWRVTSADGHPITGELSFTATDATADDAVVESPTASPTSSPSATASPSTPGPTPTASSDAVPEESPDRASTPVVVAVVVAAIVILWLLWRRRRPRHGPEDD
jgi:methionine-rich copper-binding protein CopC